jgi:SOS response regulatory protein OraA/RecX
VIEAALQELDENESAYQAAMQQASRWSGLDEASASRKCSSFLQRRGFGYDVIQEVWARIQAERTTDDSALEESEDAIKWED